MRRLKAEAGQHQPACSPPGLISRFVVLPLAFGRLQNRVCLILSAHVKLRDLILVLLN